MDPDITGVAPDTVLRRKRVWRVHSGKRVSLGFGPGHTAVGSIRRRLGICAAGRSLIPVLERPNCGSAGRRCRGRHHRCRHIRRHCCNGQPWVLGGKRKPGDTVKVFLTVVCSNKHRDFYSVGIVAGVLAGVLGCNTSCRRSGKGRFHDAACVSIKTYIKFTLLLQTQRNQWPRNALLLVLPTQLLLRHSKREAAPS